MVKPRTEGFVYLAGFISCIPIANWLIGHVGSTCVPDGPCLIAVAPGLTAPSGVLMIGLALVLASALAFFFSELADFFVYTPLQQRRFVTAVIASSLAGLVVDSVIFLWVAFHSFNFLLGQIVGKAWMVLASLPLIHWLRLRDARLARGA